MLAYNVALVGYGNVSRPNTDALLQKYYNYITHSDVIRDLKALNLEVVIDTSHAALAHCKTDWPNAKLYERVSDIDIRVAHSIDILVITTPNVSKIDIIRNFPNLKGLLVEKPAALESSDYLNLKEYCNSKKILFLTNYWRRYDKFFNKLKDHELTDIVGEPLTASVIYCNGLMNNGVHMLDLCNFLFGSVLQYDVYSKKSIEVRNNSDANIDFRLEFKQSLNVHFYGVSSGDFRENSLEIIGTKGRLSIVNEGTRIFSVPVGVSSITQDELDFNYNNITQHFTTVGDAFLSVYLKMLNDIELKNYAEIEKSFRDVQEVELLAKTLVNSKC